MQAIREFFVEGDNDLGLVCEELLDMVSVCVTTNGECAAVAWDKQRCLYDFHSMCHVPPRCFCIGVRAYVSV